MSERAQAIAARVEAFVRESIFPYEADLRATHHGPTEELVAEMRAKARAAGVMTPHIFADGSHLSQRETAIVLSWRASAAPISPRSISRARRTMSPLIAGGPGGHRSPAIASTASRAG